jgi:adenosylcobinamide-GDP ribazoletransferase
VSRTPRTTRRTSDLLAGPAQALGFLTVLPVRASAIGAAPAWFPAVGALVGALAGLARVAADDTLGPAPASILAIGVLVVVTGALHQDGLADCADGLGVRGDRARRLTVMRDSAVGVYGALALILWALLLASTLAGLAEDDALRALVIAATLGRWAALLHAVLATPARPDGLGAAFAVSAPALGVATATAFAAAFALAPPLHAAAALAAAALLAAALSAWAGRTLGGRTGDTLGATVALTELAVCLVLLVVGL